MTCGCYKKVNDKIGDVFGWYGRKVYRHPWKFIMVCVLVNCLLALGFLRLNVVSDAETLYTPENSKAFQDRDRIDNKFPSNGDFYRHNVAYLGQYVHVIMEPKSGEVLETSFMNEAQTVYKYVKNTSIQENGVNVSYEEICAKRDDTCIVDGDMFFALPAKNLLLAKQISFPDYGPFHLPSTFGKAKTENGLLVSAGAFKLRFNLNNDDDIVKHWLEKLEERMKELNTDASVAFEHSYSLNDELNSNLGADIILFSVTFTLMCTYACLATINCDCLTDRSLLGMAGVLATVLAILGAFGICVLCGVPFISIVGVTPFLVVGIGVDDMFILLSGIAEAIDHDGSVAKMSEDKMLEDRVARMMRTSGMGITITSLTDLLGFLIGSTSTFPAVRYFCIYTGVAILFCYMCHVTFFSACIALDQKRVLHKRHSKTCMVIPIRRGDPDGCRQFCCTGRKPIKREDVVSPLERKIETFFTSLVSCDIAKPFVILVLLLYWVVSIWGALFFKEGLQFENLVHSGSYFHKYSVIDRSYYPSEIMIMLTIETKSDYTSLDVRSQVQNLLKDAKSSQYIDSTFELSWLQFYSHSAFFNVTSTQAFVDNLKLFLNDESGRVFAGDIVFGPTSADGIEASRVYVRSIPATESAVQSKIMTQTREIVAKHQITTSAFSPVFIFYEQYATILEQTIQTLGIVASCIFLVTFVFMPHPFIILLVTVAVASMMTGLIAFMYFWGLTLSSITMIHVIMSVGFSVDYSAHICHAFMIADTRIKVKTKGYGSSHVDILETSINSTYASQFKNKISPQTARKYKIKNAIMHVGGPVFSGAFTSFLGIVVLAASSSYIFLSFFKVMFIVITIGILHALFFLPVILSLIGPLSTTEITRHTESTPRGNYYNRRHAGVSREFNRRSIQAIFR